MLEPGNPAAQKLYREAHIRNGWFTPENCRSALEGIAAWLTEEKLREWISPYQKKIETHASKKIGIIAAGNIPGVGFHDFLTVFLTGNYPKTTSRFFAGHHRYRFQQLRPVF
jgi:hypothetical protein